MQNNYFHNTVLLNEAINSLNIEPNGIYVDGTFGFGGHSRKILSKLNSKGKLFVFDLDPEAIKIAKAINDKRFFIIHNSFSYMMEYMKEKNLLNKINGILLDLGISSLQIDNPKRGFSFMKDGPLDMRMDNTKGKSAAEWLLKASYNDIFLVLKNFGEERYARKITNAILIRRKKKPITNTLELSKLISNIYSYKYKKKNPATKSFQAIRIHINNELKRIKLFLNTVLSILSPKGRLSVISFHSLEHKLIKKIMRKNNFNNQIPAGLPITELQLSLLKNNSPKLKEIGKIKPSITEIKNNPRSRSAILRYAEKLIL